MNIVHFEGVEVNEAAFDDAMSLRRQIFIEEDHRPEDIEIDGNDPRSEHYVGYLDGKPVAVARVRVLKPDNPNGSDVVIERVGVVSELRGRGLGGEMMDEVISDLTARPNINDAILVSQVRLLEFYRRCGFIATGEAFERHGAPHPHRQMIRSIH